MFDIGLTEMMMIGVVALIVIGPERLPGVARTAGKYFGRLKRFMTTVKADVEQELRADELRQILADQQQELNSLKDSISDAGKDVEREVSGVSAELSDTDSTDTDSNPAAEIAQGDAGENSVDDSASTSAPSDSADDAADKAKP